MEVDTSQPMSLGALVAVVGIVLTWILGAIAIRKFVIEERKRRRDDEEHLEELIGKVCKSFTESDAYQMRRDRAMISVAQSVVEESFRSRAPSLVDAGVDAERRANTDRRIAVIEESLLTLRTDFAAAAMKIAREVVKEMRSEFVK